MLFLDYRNDLGIDIYSAISFFASWQFIVPATLIVLLTLYFKTGKRIILPFAFIMIMTEAAVFLGKVLLHRPRPEQAIFALTDFSFPSGHSAISVVFYGYLAYLAVKLLKNKYSWLITTSSILIIILIGLSRLYLGVHYVSDVIAGYLIGFLFLNIGIIWTNEILSPRQKIN